MGESSHKIRHIHVTCSIIYIIFTLPVLVFFFLLLQYAEILARVCVRAGRRFRSRLKSHAYFWKEKAEILPLLHPMTTKKQIQAPHSLRLQKTLLQRRSLLRYVYVCVRVYVCLKNSHYQFMTITISKS